MLLESNMTRLKKKKKGALCGVDFSKVRTKNNQMIVWKHRAGISSKEEKN